MDHYVFTGIYGGEYVPDMPDPDQVSNLDSEVHMIPSRSKSVEVSPLPEVTRILVLLIKMRFTVPLVVFGETYTGS